ncbi:MAG TPA: glycosyltransferase family 2 protein [Terriglobales bacterium]|nr:glycosyltransferase family 2 protein [Terriglobales bacterium]
MSRTYFSVAMCTYNGARYVREQLHSIAGQSVVPDELVICDDASTDHTVELVEEFATHSSVPVRLRCNPATLGCTANFEQAIRLCRGEIIVLADQDDVWKPTKLGAIAVSFARNPAAGYVFSDAEIVDEHSDRLPMSLWDLVGFAPQQFPPSQQFAMLLRRNLVTGAAMAFRTSLRDLLLPIPDDWGHDYWIALLGSIFSYGVPIPQRLFFYRRHLAQHRGCGRDTFLQKVKTSMAAEADYRAKAARITKLRQRVAACARTAACPSAYLQLVAEKELHFSRRALIRSAHGGTRIARLLNEAVSGRYQRFSSSWSSVIRDLTASSSRRLEHVS